MIFCSSLLDQNGQPMGPAFLVNVLRSVINLMLLPPGFLNESSLVHTSVGVTHSAKTPLPIKECIKTSTPPSILNGNDLATLQFGSTLERSLRLIVIGRISATGGGTRHQKTQAQSPPFYPPLMFPKPKTHHHDYHNLDQHKDDIWEGKNQ